MTDRPSNHLRIHPTINSSQFYAHEWIPSNTSPPCPLTTFHHTSCLVHFVEVCSVANLICMHLYLNERNRVLFVNAVQHDAPCSSTNSIALRACSPLSSFRAEFVVSLFVHASPFSFTFYFSVPCIRYPHNSFRIPHALHSSIHCSSRSVSRFVLHATKLSIRVFVDFNLIILYYKYLISDIYVTANWQFD